MQDKDKDKQEQKQQEKEAQIGEYKVNPKSKAIIMQIIDKHIEENGNIPNVEEILSDFLFTSYDDE